MQSSSAKGIARVAAAVIMVLAVGTIVWWTAGHSLPVLEIGRERDEPFPLFSPPVRVCLTPSPVKELTLAIDGPYQVRAVGGSQVLGRGERLAASTVAVGPTGVRIGETVYRISRLEIVAERSPAVWVGEHQYRGTVRLFRRPGGTLIAVNVLPLEEYLASVVDSEMPAAFPEAARQAQAVVARTYALTQMEAARGHPHFDLFATVRSQKYLGFQYRTPDGRRLAGESESSRRVVHATGGMVCTWRGKLFCTYYSAVCGGRTTRGDLLFADAAPPLKSVPCTWCEAAALHRWTTELSRGEAHERLSELLTLPGRPMSLTQTADARNGAFAQFEAGDGRERHVLSAADLRRHLPPAVLPSPHFTLRQTSEKLIFEGRGHGHGVGLCQWGARGQALAGRDCLQILKHYYPGAEIVALQPAGR